MEKGDIDNYASFQEIWTSPNRYALARNGFHDVYSILDIIDHLFVLIEDEDVERLVQHKLKENGCKIFNNIHEALGIEVPPATTDIPIARDTTNYSIFIAS